MGHHDVFPAGAEADRLCGVAGHTARGDAQCGGVRIDHAMGLQRLWLVPEGASAADGRLSALSADGHAAPAARLNRTGTRRSWWARISAPSRRDFAKSWTRTGMYGMRVLWFERDEDGFTAPEQWDRSAIAMTSTHDLPTVGILVDWAPTSGCARSMGFWDRSSGRRRWRRSVTRTDRRCGRRCTMPALPKGRRRPQMRRPDSWMRRCVRRACRVPAGAAAAGGSDRDDGATEPAGHDGSAPELAPAHRAGGGGAAGRACRGAPRGCAECRKAAPMMPPRATMRLQLHKGFTFDDASRVVPYMARLGISHLYCFADPDGAPGVDARLRRGGSHADQPGAWRRAGVPPHERRRCAGQGWA